MLLLPTFNAVLRPCSINPATFSPHAKGHFCGSCQRVVQDFSQSANPVADLAAARAAAPNGRVCGTFRPEQVQAPPTLTRRLKWFLVALLLVVGQGLTAREALAQVRRLTPSHSKTVNKHQASSHLQRSTTTTVEGDIIGPQTPEYGFAEEMPTFQGGNNASMVAYIQQHMKLPLDAATAEDGRIYVSFIIGKDSQIHNPKILKGLHPLLDAEVLRVVQTMHDFKPGKQNGRPVDVTMTLPITVRHF